MEDSGVYAPQNVGGYERMDINSSLEQKENIAQYNIQSVLHFIQSEWTRLELQRSQWEMERAELQARIAFLQGERRGQENLKHDLVRRIKMLEHALKEERVHYHKLLSSSDQSSNENIKPGPDNAVENLKELKHILDPGQQLSRCTEQAMQSNSKWRESRQRLKHFLQELGYTDSVVAVRQNRVRQLLCATNSNISELNKPGMPNIIGPQNAAEREITSLIESEEAAMHTFDFLDNATKLKGTEDTDAPWSHDYNGKTNANHNGANAANTNAISSLISNFDSNASDQGSCKRYSRKTAVDSNLMEFLSSLSEKEGETGQMTTEGATWTIDGQQQLHDDLNAPADIASNSASQNTTSDSVGGTAANLGDLASLTVANESENGADAEQCDTGFLQSQNESGVSQKQNTENEGNESRRPWTKKFVLRGHFDAVRSIAFHPNEPYLFTASEDGLVMLWALHRPGSPRPNAVNAKPVGHAANAIGADLDAVHIYRGHAGPVLNLSVPSLGQCASSVFSSGIDGVIRGWRLPQPDSFSGSIDLYSQTQTDNELGPILRREEGSEAVWSLSVHPSEPMLTSVDTASAVSFWPLTSDVISESPLDVIAPSRTIFLGDLITPIGNEPSLGRATCLTYFTNRPYPSNATQCLVGTNTGWLALIDIETGQLVNKIAPALEAMDQDQDPFHQTVIQDPNALTFPASGWGPRGIHALTVYQTFSLAISGHEDKRIRFYDVARQGGCDVACVGTTVTHLDAVTCLTVDPHDLFVLTGSHDSSIRLWDLDTRTCVQEITCHRVKNNESVHAVAMHPTLPFAASGGADAICKVYTSQ